MANFLRKICAAQICQERQERQESAASRRKPSAETQSIMSPTVGALRYTGDGGAIVFWIYAPAALRLIILKQQAGIPSQQQYGNDIAQCHHRHRDVGKPHTRSSEAREPAITIPLDRSRNTMVRLRFFLIKPRLLSP